MVPHSWSRIGSHSRTRPVRADSVVACQFPERALPGAYIGRGRVVRRGASLAFLAGELLTETGTAVATVNATTTIQSIRVEPSA